MKSPISLQDEKVVFDTVQELLGYVKHCTSPQQTVSHSISILESNGFVELGLGESWHLTSGNYYINVYGTTLIAFHIGTQYRHNLRIASAHTDFPAIRVKPNPLVIVSEYGKLNVEMYGGLILHTWLDRPLGASGTVILKGENPFDVREVTIDSNRPIAIIPSLAIHMNRHVNEGIALQRQKEMLPIIMMKGSTKDSEYDQWLDFLAGEAQCNPDDILSFEVTLYPTEDGTTVGLYDEFISAPRLDNLTSCKACLSGILEASENDVNGIRLIALFDNEEVGSRTKQGGASMMLPNVLERIYRSLGFAKDELDMDMAEGFMISSDVAHGLHPNYPEKNDITNEPILNRGIVLKVAASQSYANDAKAIGIVKSLCEIEDIPYQYFVNRSDIPGGSTVGSISSTMLPMRTMDVGVPIWAMHSARETMGTLDQYSLESLMRLFIGGN